MIPGTTSKSDHKKIESFVINIAPTTFIYPSPKALPKYRRFTSPRLACKKNFLPPTIKGLNTKTLIASPISVAITATGSISEKSDAYAFNNESLITAPSVTRSP